MFLKNKKIALSLLLSSMLTGMIVQSSSAIEKIDERTIVNTYLEKIVAKDIDIMDNRIQTYPCENYSKDNITIQGDSVVVNEPGSLNSIGNEGIVRLLKIKIKDKETSYLTVEYPNSTVLIYNDIENLNLNVKDGAVVNLGDKIASASKVTVSIIKNGNPKNPYALLFNDLYPRGGMNIPIFSQLDSRWKNDSYGDSNIYIAGCGPSSLSMVYSFFEKRIITPEMVVKEIGGANSKYMISNQGSSWSLMTEAPKMYGIKGKEISSKEIISELKKNHPVIALMGNGYFTNSGHFIVLRGIDTNGNLLVNDPADFKQNFKKSFSLSLLEKQSKHFWSYEKVEE